MGYRSARSSSSCSAALQCHTSELRQREGQGHRGPWHVGFSPFFLVNPPSALSRRAAKTGRPAGASAENAQGALGVALVSLLESSSLCDPLRDRPLSHDRCILQITPPPLPIQEVPPCLPFCFSICGTQCQRLLGLLGHTRGAGNSKGFQSETRAQKSSIFACICSWHFLRIKHFSCRSISTARRQVCTAC